MPRARKKRRERAVLTARVACHDVIIARRIEVDPNPHVVATRFWRACGKAQRRRLNKAKPVAIIMPDGKCYPDLQLTPEVRRAITARWRQANRLYRQAVKAAQAATPAEPLRDIRISDLCWGTVEVEDNNGPEASG